MFRGEEGGKGKLGEWQRCLLSGNERLLGCLAAWPVGLAGFGLLHLFFSVQMAEEQREEGGICGGGASRPLNFI